MRILPALLALVLLWSALADDEVPSAPDKRGPAPADSADFDPHDPRHKSYRRHLDEIARYRGLRPIRARYAAIGAITVNPDGWEAYLALGEHLWPRRTTMLLREAYRRNPGVGGLIQRIRRDLARPPVSKKFGRAERVELFYLGRSRADLDFERDRLPSVDVGETLDPRRLIVQAFDGGNDFVPIDPVFEGRDGLEVRGDRVVAVSPSRAATLVVRDRKTGKTAECRIRVCGPVKTIRVRRSRTQGKATLAPGEMLHMRTRLEDAAGNYVWRERLVWTAKGESEENLTALLARGYSWMHFDVTYEPHVQTLMGGRKGVTYAGALTVTATEPESGATGTLTVEVVKGKEGARKRDHGGWTWRTEVAAGKAEARRLGRPYIIYFHATW